jgi:hypothetical protein
VGTVRSVSQRGAVAALADVLRRARLARWRAPASHRWSHCSHHHFALNAVLEQGAPRFFDAVATVPLRFKQGMTMDRSTSGLGRSALAGASSNFNRGAASKGLDIRKGIRPVERRKTRNFSPRKFTRLRFGLTHARLAALNGSLARDLPAAVSSHPRK